jgi:hypothetical protein
MVVVPALALFSHHVPPGLTAAVREAVSRQTAAWSGRQEAAAVPREPAVAPPADTPAPPPAGAAVPSPPQAVAGATQPVPAGSTAARRTVEDRLLELGATAIECQPMPGGSGALVASCRVAVDASGQLQRVFQAGGPDPTAALERLFVDVQAWRQRAAADSRTVTR